MATYDLQPEMSAYLVADECVKRIESDQYDVIILNFANCDMVGHTGVFEAAVKAVEAVDACAGKVIGAVLAKGGAVLLTDTGRRTFLQKWQEGKKETITHPFLEEKIPWGLVPYVQSLLLARYLRGDLDDYPPFLWK